MRAATCEGKLTASTHACRDDPFCEGAVSANPLEPTSGLCTPECFTCYWLIRAAPIFRCDSDDYSRLHPDDCGVFILQDALDLWFKLLLSPKARYMASAAEAFGAFPWTPHMACRCIGVCQSDVLERLSTQVNGNVMNKDYPHRMMFTCTLVLVFFRHPIDGARTTATTMKSQLERLPFSQNC